MSSLIIFFLAFRAIRVCAKDISFIYYFCNLFAFVYAPKISVLLIEIIIYCRQRCADQNGCDSDLSIVCIIIIIIAVANEFTLAKCVVHESTHSNIIAYFIGILSQSMLDLHTLHQWPV